MPRERNGWGNCVKCNEELTPEDKEPSADRCEFCLATIKIWNVIHPRIAYIEKQIKYFSTEGRIAKSGTTGVVYWTNKLETYNAIKEHLRGILKLKRTLDGETYPSSTVSKNG